MRPSVTRSQITCSGRPAKPASYAAPSRRPSAIARRERSWASPTGTWSAYRAAAVRGPPDQRGQPAPVRAEVDAGQHDLAVAGRRRGPRAALQVGQDARQGPAARLPHDAERAAVVAPVLDLEHVPRAPRTRRLDGSLDP